MYGYGTAFVLILLRQIRNEMFFFEKREIFCAYAQNVKYRFAM